MTPTKFRQPRTGDAQLRVRFRNGMESKWTYAAKQLRWSDTGSPFDIIEVGRA